MQRPENALMVVEAELTVPVATLQLVQYVFVAPVSGALHENEEYRLDLCLTPRPRNARAASECRQPGDFACLAGHAHLG